uniref:Uncharacterized protein n=1 Tax=Arundo donax TaxID=35708 RepID=A0A0A9FYW7_ARUDO
MLSVCGAV